MSRRGIPALLSALTALGLVLTTGCAPAAQRVATAAGSPPVLWRAPAPTDRPSASPRPPFRFVEEDREGDSPKFTVVDANGTRWRVKLGPEAHTEIAAAALLTATGYFADEMYYLERAQVSGLEQLRRGREFVEPDGYVRGAQFEARPPRIERGDAWDWADNPFVGTPPLDGLRVLMVLINNYDARTANNRVLHVLQPDGTREVRYVVTDLGASFGRYGGLGGTRSKGDLEGYRASRFIAGVSGTDVRFAYRTRPEGLATTLFVLNPFYALGEMKKEHDLQRVPLAHVRWIADLLQRLPEGTVRSAFAQAGYDATVADGFASVVTDRIRQLTGL